MSIFLSRCLALATSFILVLPQSWCCYVGVGECCGTEQQSCCMPQKAEDASASLKGQHCCCRDEDADQSTPKVPSSKPNQPGRSICCERLPIDRPAKDKALTDLTISICVQAFLESPTPQAIFADGFEEGVVVSPAPIHILHCVWLC